MALHLLDFFLTLSAPAILQWCWIYCCSYHWSLQTVAQTKDCSQQAKNAPVPGFRREQMETLRTCWCAGWMTTAPLTGYWNKTNQFMKNSSHHTGTGMSPFKAMFGVEAKVGLRSSTLPDEVINMIETEEDPLRTFVSVSRKIQVQNTEMQNHFRMLQQVSFLSMIFKAAILEVVPKKLLLKKTVPVLPTPQTFVKKLTSLSLRWTVLWNLLMVVQNGSLITPPPTLNLVKNYHQLVNQWRWTKQGPSACGKWKWQSSSIQERWWKWTSGRKKRTYWETC